jgi:hypothetical protein
MSAPKVASELHWESGVRISDQSVSNRLLRNVNLLAQRPLVVVHLTHVIVKRMLQPAVCAGLRVFFTDEFRFQVEFADGRTSIWEE